MLDLSFVRGLAAMIVRFADPHMSRDYTELVPIGDDPADLARCIVLQAILDDPNARFAGYITGDLEADVAEALRWTTVDGAPLPA